MSHIRAAFDIGSSHHKLIVAHYIPSPYPNQPPTIQPILSLSERVPLADSLTSSSYILSSTLQTSNAVIKRLMYQASKHGAVAYTAIATQVFRVATNGTSHLSTLFPTSVPVSILSASEEGKIAFDSVRAALPSSINTQSLLVWDSGGGSTQFTQTLPTFAVHPLSIGAAAARATFDQFIQHPNRVKKLAKWVRKVALPMDNHQLKEKAQQGVVIGIGGATSMFALAAAGVGKGECFTKDQVWKLIYDIDRDHNYGHDKTRSILPKLVLLAEMMNVYHIQRVRHMPLNGSCMGLLANDDIRFWGDQLKHITNSTISSTEGHIKEQIVLPSNTTPVSTLRPETAQYTSC